MTGPSEPKKRLDGMGAIGKAFKFVFGNLGHLFATSILTLFVVALFQIAYTWATIDDLIELQTQALIFTDETDASALMSSIGDLYFSPNGTFMMIASFVISLVFSGMFAVRWHRSALFGSDADNTGFGFEFSNSLGRYVINIVLITLVSLVIILIPSAVFVSAVGGNNLGLAGIAGPLILVALVASLYVSGRLMIALPAAALGIPNFGLREAWQHSNGHGWGILGASIVMYLAVIVLIILVSIPLSIVGSLFLGPWEPPMIDDLDLIVAWQMEVARPQIWWETLSSLLFYPVIAGVVTSFYSYIYLQIGKPPAWVEEQGEA